MITRHVPTRYIAIPYTTQGFQNNYFGLDAMNYPRKSISGETGMVIGHRGKFNAYCPTF
jgi:hypothetical protein